MFHSPRLQRLVQQFNPKHNLAEELVTMIMWASVALECVYLKRRPLTTRLLQRLYAFALFARRVYAGEANLDFVVDWLQFPLWLESGEPFSVISPLLERRERISHRSDMAANATRFLLMSGHYEEARAANRLWCEITEAWWQQTKPLAKPQWLLYKLIRAWIKAETQHDLDVSRSRGREALMEDLVKLNRQEKQRLLQHERKLPRPLSSKPTSDDMAGSLAKDYRNSHLWQKLLDWSASRNDEPLDQLRAQVQPQRFGMRRYSLPPLINTAALMGVNRDHYLSLVKRLTQDVRSEFAALDLDGIPEAVSSSL